MLTYMQRGDYESSFYEVTRKCILQRTTVQLALARAKMWFEPFMI